MLVRNILILINLLEIKGYNLVPADHLNNVKRAGVCIYYKESLHVGAIKLPPFNEALVLEMSHKNYRSPSQYNNEFELFSSNFEKLTIHVNSCKPYLSIITGDVNARSSSLWSNDINTTEGTKLFARTSSDGLQQLINEPTHIQRKLSSCTDVILTDVR